MTHVHIIHRGLGILGLGVPVLVLAVSSLIWAFLLAPEENAPAPKLYFPLACLLATAAVWRTGELLERRAAKVPVVRQFGTGRMVANKHDLFRIPVKYWAYPWMLISAVVFYGTFFR